MAAEGADVIVNYRNSKMEADEVVTQITAMGRRAIAVQGDVAKRAGVLELFATVEREFGRLDILVNNTGMFFSAQFEELTEEQWDTILDTNLKSQFLCSQVDAPLLRRALLHRTGLLEDIDEAVIFLVRSPFITGQVIVVDGGRTLA